MITTAFLSGLSARKAVFFACREVYSENICPIISPAI